MQFLCHKTYLMKPFKKFLFSLSDFESLSKIYLLCCNKTLKKNFDLVFFFEVPIYIIANVYTGDLGN